MADESWESSEKSELTSDEEEHNFMPSQKEPEWTDEERSLNMAPEESG